MDSIFRAPWEALALDDVEAFLADAGDEGLTWEAKGGERPHPRAAANALTTLRDALGGYGRAHVALCVAARFFHLMTLRDGALYEIPGRGEALAIKRWTNDDGIVGDELIESMVRELLRASGAEVWERD